MGLFINASSTGNKRFKIQIYEKAIYYPRSRYLVS